MAAFKLVRTSKLPIYVFLVLSHVKDRDHVSVRHKHVHRKVDDTWVELHMVWDTFMENNIPFFRAFWFHWRIEAYTIAPKVLHCTQFILYLIKPFADEILAFCGKFEIKLMVICFNIHTLHICVKVFIDEHKVWVELDAAVLSYCNSNLIALACLPVSFSNWAVLDKRRAWHCRSSDHDSELHHFHFPFLFTGIVCTKEADLALLQVFNHYGRLAHAYLLNANNLISVVQVQVRKLIFSDIDFNKVWICLYRARLDCFWIFDTVGLHTTVDDLISVGKQDRALQKVNHLIWCTLD